MGVGYLLLALTFLCSCGLDLGMESNYEHQVRLFNDLFDNKTYSNQLRPVDNTNKTLEVFMEFDLITLADLDEKAQTMTTSALLKFMWKDHHMGWDKEKYGGVSNLLVSQQLLWLPDITLGNSITPGLHLGDRYTQVRVQHDHWLQWEPSIMVETDCDIIVTYYPFDTQQCSVEFRTLRTTNDEVDIIIANDSKNRSLLNKYNEDGTWAVAGYSMHRDVDDEGHEHLVFNFLFERRNTFYVINMILPVVFLSLTASLVFALPCDEGEKMGTCITILLAYAVYLSIVSEYLPDTSLQVSLLAVYLTLLLGLTAFGVVFTVLVLRLHFLPEDKPVGDLVARMTSCLERITCYSADSYSSVKQGDSIGDEAQGSDADDSMTWQKVAKVLDWFLFLLFSIVSLGTTVLFMLMLALGSHVNRPELPDAPELEG